MDYSNANQGSTKVLPTPMSGTSPAEEDDKTCQLIQLHDEDSHNFSLEVPSNTDYWASPFDEENVRALNQDSNTINEGTSSKKDVYNGDSSLRCCRRFIPLLVSLIVLVLSFIILLVSMDAETVHHKLHINKTEILLKLKQRAYNPFDWRSYEYEYEPYEEEFFQEYEHEYELAQSNQTEKEYEFQQKSGELKDEYESEYEPTYSNTFNANEATNP